jgi:hypothetical protein
VLSLEEGGAQSRAAYDKAVEDDFHHQAVTVWWQKAQARQEQARQEQARQEQLVHEEKLVAHKEMLAQDDQRQAACRQAEAEQQLGAKRLRADDSWEKIYI